VSDRIAFLEFQRAEVAAEDLSTFDRGPADRDSFADLACVRRRRPPLRLTG